MKAKDVPVAKQIYKLIGCLNNIQRRINYGFARKGGYSISSAGIESAISSSTMYGSSAQEFDGMWRLRAGLRVTQAQSPKTSR